MRVFVCALGFVLASITLLAQQIPAKDAAKHVGENATVCGTIASEHTATSSKGTPTFINLDRPYPDQVFTLLIWGADREQVGKVPETGEICGIGVITEYRGSPEIVLRDAKSWYVPKYVWSAARLQRKSVGEKTSLRKCIRPLRWRLVLLARMSCARACPYKSVGCSFETNFGTRLQARRCGCSVVLAAPVQTSVGKNRSS